MEEKGMKGYQQQAVPVVLVPQSMADDEISLMNLWEVLRRRRWVFIGTALTVLLFAVAYALLAKPVYKAEAYLLPPSDSDIQTLQVLPVSKDGKDPNITTKKAYALFVQFLESRSLRREYFKQHHLLDYLGKGASNAEDVFLGFNKAMDVIRAGQNKERVKVSFEGHDASHAAQWINGFIAMVNKNAVAAMIKDISGKLASMKQDITDEIDAKRKSAFQRREDRITQLDDAIGIAEQVGIKAPDVKASSSSGHVPLYLLGYKALKAEVKVLRARKNDDPFITGLRSLQEKLLQLNMIHFDSSHVTAVTVDQLAIAPDKPIAPKRKLVVGLGLILALIAGFFSAYLADFIIRSRAGELR